MNKRMVLHTLGYVLGAEAVLLLLPLLVSFLYGEDTIPFLITIGLLAAACGSLLCIRPRTKNIYARDGFFIVSASWILVSLFGALPFVLDGAIPSYVDALFETVSGFTTTGASILSDVETVPYGLLFWRSFTHWIGGMGVLVFIMAILPMANERSMHVMRAEVPGPSVGKLVPRARRTALLLFGINFNLYFLLLMREFRQILKSEELWVYLGTSVTAMLLIALNILPMYNGFGDAFRHSSFQVSSVITTTGFATADFNLWPTFSKIVLFMLMFLGACGGSTGGGIKVSRLIILVKKLSRDIVRMVHPRSVGPVRLDGKKVDEETVNGVGIFFAAYILMIAFITLLISLDGFDFETTLSAVVACISNIGPGMGAVGPMGNFADFSVFSKLLLSLTMLLGRLEIFPLILTLTPILYRKQ